MTASSCVYIVGAIALALLTVCNSAAVEGEIRATVRAESANLQRRDTKNVAAFRKNGGSITYNTRIFPGERPSPVGAIARVNDRIRIRAKSKNKKIKIGSPASNDIKPRGFNQLGAKWERCHLIANSLGGSGRDARNLFACPRFTNVPVMSHYEDKLRNYLQKNPQALVKYEVSLTYTNAADYPTSVRMRATEGSTLLFDVRFNNSVESAMFITVCDGGTLTQTKPVPSKLQNTKQWATEIKLDV